VLTKGQFTAEPRVSHFSGIREGGAIAIASDLAEHVEGASQRKPQTVAFSPDVFVR
jgi:hypothetical protein